MQELVKLQSATVNNSKPNRLTKKKKTTSCFPKTLYSKLKRLIKLVPTNRQKKQPKISFRVD